MNRRQFIHRAALAGSTLPARQSMNRRQFIHRAALAGSTLPAISEAPASRPLAPPRRSDGNVVKTFPKK
jgi:hypothetical protein